MPTASAIVEQLHVIANRAGWLAIVWHVVIASVVAGALLGWRPRPRIVGLLVLGPVLSVAIVAVSFGSWFNAATFGVLAIACASLIGTAHGDASDRLRGWQTWVALALIAYGLVYPHFVAGPWYRNLYASPVGLLPCPTVATVAGLALNARAPRSRTLRAVLAAWAAFYALFGMIRLGVALDAGLLVAAVALAAAPDATIATGDRKIRRPLRRVVRARRARGRERPRDRVPSTLVRP
jgi:hypothetical protein